MSAPVTNSSSVHVFRVLELVARSEEPLTVTEVARDCGLPNSTAHRALATLEQVGYVRRAEGAARYASGLQLQQVRHALLRRWATRWWDASSRWGPTSPGWRSGAGWGQPGCGPRAVPAGGAATGRENLCPASTYTGWDEDGGYAEQVTVPAAYAYFPLPTEFSDHEAAPLLCAGIIGYRALRRAQLPPGGRLGVYGFGASAHLTAQLAVAQGAEVHVLTRAEPTPRRWLSSSEQRPRETPTTQLRCPWTRRCSSRRSGTWCLSHSRRSVHRARSRSPASTSAMSPC